MTLHLKANEERTRQWTGTLFNWLDDSLMRSFDLHYELVDIINHHKKLGILS